MNQLNKHPSHTVELHGIGHLPADLLIEILSRLPPKHLCRLRSVCKSWNALLSRDAAFISRHMELAKREPLLLMRRYISDKPDMARITMELTSIDMRGNITDIFREELDGPVHTFISCGPLSLLSSAHSLYVCNPSLRRLARVPPAPSGAARIHNVGFGYLPKTNEYKIAHMYHNSSIQNSCDVFSFEITGGVASGSWRSITTDCALTAWTDEYPVCVAGSIYWAVSSGWKEKTMLSLDLEKEEFGSVAYPKHESKKYSFLEYVGLMGTLSVVGFSGEESSMDVWMMKDKRRKIWTMEHSINLSPLCPKFLIPSDDQSEEILVHMEDKDVVCYNIRSRALRKIEYYRAMKTYNKPCMYHCSLIPLHSSGS